MSKKQINKPSSTVNPNPKGYKDTSSRIKASPCQAQRPRLGAEGRSATRTWSTCWPAPAAAPPCPRPCPRSVDISIISIGYLYWYLFSAAAATSAAASAPVRGTAARCAGGRGWTRPTSPWTRSSAWSRCPANTGAGGTLLDWVLLLFRLSTKLDN